LGGTIEECGDLVVGRRAEVFVPEPDRVEGLGRPGAHDLVHFFANGFAGVGGSAGHADDDSRRTLTSKRPGCDPHGRPCRQTVVDEDDGASTDDWRRAAAPVVPVTSCELLLLSSNGALDPLGGDAEGPNGVGIDEGRDPHRDGAHRQLLMAREAELPDQEDVERHVERLCDLVRDRDASAWQSQDQNVLAPAIVRET
jgi:hypothetical protein